jgi:hypothetical protein
MLFPSGSLCGQMKSANDQQNLKHFSVRFDLSIDRPMVRHDSLAPNCFAHFSLDSLISIAMIREHFLCEAP